MRNTAKRILNRWKTEYDFKTYITATGSFAVTLFFAFFIRCKREHAAAYGDQQRRSLDCRLVSVCALDCERDQASQIQIKLPELRCVRNHCHT